MTPRLKLAIECLHAASAELFAAAEEAAIPHVGFKLRTGTEADLLFAGGALYVAAEQLECAPTVEQFERVARSINPGQCRDALNALADRCEREDAA